MTDFVYVRYEPVGGGPVSAMLVWIIIASSLIAGVLCSWRLAPLESSLSKVAALSGAIVGAVVVFAIFFVSIGWNFHFWIGGSK